MLKYDVKLIAENVNLDCYFDSNELIFGVSANTCVVFANPEHPIIKVHESEFSNDSFIKLRKAGDLDIHLHDISFFVTPGLLDDFENIFNAKKYDSSNTDGTIFKSYLFTMNVSLSWIDPIVKSTLTLLFSSASKSLISTTAFQSSLLSLSIYLETNDCHDVGFYIIY